MGQSGAEPGRKRDDIGAKCGSDPALLLRRLLWQGPRIDDPRRQAGCTTATPTRHMAPARTTKNSVSAGMWVVKATSGTAPAGGWVTRISSITPMTRPTVIVAAHQTGGNTASTSTLMPAAAR